MNWTHLWHRKGAIEHGEWKVMKFWYRKWTDGLIWFLRIVEDASLTQFGSVLWRLCFWRAISLITVRFARYLLRQQRAGRQLLSLLRWLSWCGCCVVMSMYDISCVAVVGCSLACLRPYWVRCLIAIHSCVPRRSASLQSSVSPSSCSVFCLSAMSVLSFLTVM